MAKLSLFKEDFRFGVAQLRGGGAGDGTEVTVMVKGFCGGAVLSGTEVGVTVTLGVMVGFFEVSGNIMCSLAADKPRTISSNFRRFFSFPTTGSSIGCKKRFLSTSAALRFNQQNVKLKYNWVV